MARDAGLTIVVIEDKPDTRESLRVLLNGTEGYRCEAAFGSMEEAMPRLSGEAPKAVLVDIGLPGISGIEGIRWLHKRYPESALIALTVYEDDERIFAALCAGASGYLLKKTAPVRLLESIKEAVEGGAPMSPEVARRVINSFRNRRPVETPEHNLTPHEMRILTLLAEGHNYTTAAEKLGVTVNAVAFHMKRIYENTTVRLTTSIRPASPTAVDSCRRICPAAI
jgi:DNA-binding NarL/FixJ family response regulator